MSFSAQPDGEFPAAIPRRMAARLLLLDVSGRVLLLRHGPPLHEPHWAGPGGGLDGDESPADALARELTEELRLDCALRFRPIGTWRHIFRYRGEPVVQHESLYEARLPAGFDPADVSLGWHADADGIIGLGWFAPAELADIADEVWPAGLFSWLDRRGADEVAGSPKESDDRQP